MSISVFLRKKKGVACLLALLLAAAACDNSTDTAPTGPAANLVVSFEPNPVTHVSQGEWQYTVYLSETAGVGVYIYGWISKGYSAAGVELPAETHGEVAFIEEFAVCGGEENYLEGGSTRCANLDLVDRRNSGWQIITFYGVDDFGNEVTGEGRLDLL